MPDSRNRETAREDTRDIHIGKILNDFLDRKTRGETVGEADLMGQYPEFADDLRRHLRFLRNLEPSGDQIGRLIASGVLEKPLNSTCLAQLGPYGIIGLLGRGGMSVVLKAYEESLDRTVALKILRPELTHDHHALKRFTREAKAAAGLQHPNIVTVHAVGEERGTHYLLMELIDGPTLASLIRECGPLPAATTRHLLRQILSGLGVAHGANLVHRDIKPSNILLAGLLSESGVESNSSAKEESSLLAKIADFGLARVASSHSRITLPDAVLGTPEYMSPEQACGKEDIDHRADLYSAGVVLYEMLTGRTPFNAEKPSAVIHRILHEDPPDPRALRRTVDPKLASLTLRLMAKQPEDRFDSAEEAVAALDTGQRVTSLEQRRRRVRGMVLGSTALVLIGAVAWMVKHNGSAPDFIESRSVVTNVWSTPEDPQEHCQRRIWADYSDGRTKQVFYEFGEKAGKVRATELVDFDGDGRNDGVVAGIHSFVDVNCLFMFDLDGKLAWSMDLTPERQINWPDIDGPPTRWSFRTLDVGDVDRKAGDELIVVAGHRTQYPRRLSVIEPATQTMRATFWHMGDLNQLLIDADFPYEDGDRRPAIVAIGVNNKLDGFGDPSPRPYIPREGEAQPQTEHRQVPIVTVLDPKNMDGLAPPRTNRIDLSPVIPWAYAYLDLSTIAEEQRGPGMPFLSPAAGLRRLRQWFTPERGGQDVLVQVAVVRLGGSVWREIHWDTLVLSRDLCLRGVIPGGLQEPPPGSGGWEDLWHPIIQRGRFVVD